MSATHEKSVRSSIAATRAPTRRPPRFMPAGQQRSLAGRYPLWIKGIALTAFAWAFMGWLNDTWFFLFDTPLWLNRYTEQMIILVFGIWRISAEKNPHNRKRLAMIVANITVLWWMLPWLFPFVEPYIGYLGGLPAFPSLHAPGTLTFFLVLGAVFLFGRRVICGWNCPCVGIREVAGFPFRHRNHVPRGPWSWRLRHLKWFWFALYLGAMWAMTRPANNLTATYLGGFAMAVGLSYFITMMLSPWMGNRGYCRFFCPYGATFGLLNKAGMFHIDFDAATCNQCGSCEKVCDMGIAVWHLGAAEGKISTTECMGCGRCVVECPTGSLAFHDVRNRLFPSLRQDRRHLLKLADWNHPASRWRLMGFVLALLLALTMGWYYSSRIGSGAELINNLGTLCGLPITTW
ncbi:MAG: 4Fe-4S binding protein [Magnetococcales bacterium]|nr:4Fe-4S binding protein [Magnetococcales bacterium]MBF0148615.1 4Fe-4S binding protein [Magnetococcales bacterium]MBF0172745.1 4Fe-4S binding protein [Magnetococcales bacterium]MBF0348071.1 4Fe-4S binding protein [Magnetococcales bacterium]MBF0630856.1 4Fe-4S binding protein [Magnetococcales bacterium]